LVLGDVHGGRHGRYLHGKGRALAVRRDGVARTHGDHNDTLCHLQPLCHHLGTVSVAFLERLPIR